MLGWFSDARGVSESDGGNDIWMQVAKQFKDTLRNSGAEVVRARILNAENFPASDGLCVDNYSEDVSNDNHCCGGCRSTVACSLRH